MDRNLNIFFILFLTALICLFLGGSKLLAQENILFTNYKHNKLFFNPAYTGCKPFMEVALGYRKQWTGVDGAPKSAILSTHAPINNSNIGLGAMLYSNKIGILNENAFLVNYAYHIDLPKERILSFGLQSGIISKEVRWSELITYDPDFMGDDPSIPNMNVTSLAPNFGLGFYYQTAKFHIGFSAPRVLTNSYPNEEGIGKNIDFAVKDIYFYLHSGTHIKLNSDINLDPSVLIFSSYNSTTNTSFNLELNHSSGILAGGSYRSGKYWSIIMGYEFNSKMGISYSYENSFDKYIKGDQTSHEIFLNYKISLKKSSYTSPRFF